jgi:hypothetical protein
MTELASWLLTLALFVPQPENERRRETPEQRAARVAVIAEAIAEAVNQTVMTGRWPGARRRELAAAALATAIRESGGLALKVHNGEKRGLVGEVCYMQINVTNRPGYAGFKFNELVGVDNQSSLRCALAGVRTLARARANCRGKVPPSELLGGVLSQYLRGSRCNTNREGGRRLRLALGFLETRRLTFGVDIPQWPYTLPKFLGVEGPPSRPRLGGTPCRTPTGPSRLASPKSSWGSRKRYARSSALSWKWPKLRTVLVCDLASIAWLESASKTPARKLVSASPCSEVVS